MKDLNRYKAAIENGLVGHVKCSDGKWVKYEDYIELLDQVIENLSKLKELRDQNQVGNITIKDNGGTYLIEHSVLPVFLDEDYKLFAREQYEQNNQPCDHPLADLKSDGVLFELELISSSGIQ